MRWANRRAARPVAAAANAWGLTPNSVTAMSGIASLAGLAVLVLADRSVVSGVTVAVLLALGFVLDSADGQLARLSGMSGPAGEWVDHVVDALRAPTVHVAVGAALYLGGERGWLLLVPVAFGLLTVVQFFSQTLADHLVRAGGRSQDPAEGGVLKSFALLPVDTGTLCWMFVLWGLPTAFLVAYVGLFACNLVHTVASMRRKHVMLVSMGETR
ncbi:CDP-alcohol phosphatidyltransferase family protein [Pseudactinotalea sp.]|uniref:CDP-alcohol phosphatidyltransferase family protein n=1 Tax=Pseudactinotalea sp. TaxID=1926260 RepID=UPI003B3A1771